MIYWFSDKQWEEAHKKSVRKSTKTWKERRDVDAVAKHAVVKCLPVTWGEKDYRFTKWSVSGHRVTGIRVCATEFDSGNLVVKEDESKYRVCLLVIVDLRRRKVAFRGWAYAHEAMKKQFYAGIPRGGSKVKTYRVPALFLRPMSELKENLERDKDSVNPNG